MKTFQIITDSSCDLPQELADKLELLVLPLHFTIGGKTYANYLDGREIGFHDFFERIRQGEAASTSAVNPESFREVMEQTLQQGLDILFVGFSSGLSTTLSVRVHRSGRSARKIPRAQDSDGRQPVRVSGAGLIRLPRRAAAAGGKVHRGSARLSGRHQAPSLPLVHGGRSDVLKARRQNFCHDCGSWHRHADQARHAHG